MNETPTTNVRAESENPMAAVARRAVRLSVPPTGVSVQNGASQSFSSTPPSRHGDLVTTDGDPAEPFLLDFSEMDDPTQLML